MPLRLLALAAALAGCAADAPAASGPDRPPSATPDPMTLFSFDDDASGWSIQNDGVMGGDSQGAVEVEGGALVFTGTVVTEGGGFTSALAPVGRDLSGAEGVEMRVRGGGRTFELELDDGTTDRGRQVSRRAPFPTTDDWRTVRVAFSDLETSVFGEPVEAPAFEPADVQAVGLYIIDGQDGPFRLEVDWVRTYGR